jgi:hypothetical protein
MTSLILIRANRHMHFQIVPVQWFAEKRREARLYLCDRVPLQWLAKMVRRRFFFSVDSLFPFSPLGDGRLNASM